MRGIWDAKDNGGAGPHGIQKGARVAVALALMALAGCDSFNTTTVTGPQQDNNFTLEVKVPTPAASPTATPTGSAATACTFSPVSVRLFPFGFTGCANPPANTALSLPSGCVADMTATPKDANGLDYPDEASIHNADPTWSFSGPVSWTEPIINGKPEHFNRRLVRTGAGTIAVSVNVCGTVGSWTAAN